MADVTRYEIDPERSEVSLAARSSVHPIIASVHPRGWFEGIEAGVFTTDSPLQGHIEIPVEDLTSGNALIDRETRRRIDSREHPVIVGDLVEVVELEERRILVEGEIGFVGESVLVEGELRLGRTQDDEPTIAGEGTIDVRWWGMSPPSFLMLRVEPEVEVSVRLVLHG